MTVSYVAEYRPPKALFELLIWRFVGQLIFRLTPAPLFTVRNHLLRLFGSRIGSRVRIYPSVRIWMPSRLRIGDDVGIGECVYLYNKELIDIGTGSVISRSSFIATASHDYNDPCFALVLRPVLIERFCWIAASSIVLPGVRLSEGSVIGAGSVVTKNTMKWSVYCGNPASFVKHRVDTSS